MARTKQTFRQPIKKSKTGQASSSHRSPPSSPEASPPREVRFKPIPSPSTVVKSFRNKGIIVEKKCVVEDLVDYGVPAIMEDIGWGGILNWSGNAFPSLVHDLYESICASTNNSFTIRFEHGEEVVTTKKIASILGVPRSNGPKIISEVLPLDEKDEVTHALCGRAEVWTAKNCLQASLMVPSLRIIHILFTHSIYPRKGNRTEVTPYMANLLFKVISGDRVCLPSVIMHHILRVITGSQPCAAPFGFLITQLARSYGVVPPASERPVTSTVFNKSNILLMKLPPPQQRNPVAEGDAELEAAEIEPIDPVAGQPPHPEPPQQRSLEDRMTSLEHIVSTIRTDYQEFRQEVSGMMKKTLKYLSNISSSCRRHDDAVPPSPTDSS